jgi:signal transduction histidine kinase
VSEALAGAAARERARDGPRSGLEAVPPLALALAALAATGAAVYVTATSRHAPNPEGHAALMVVVCLTFVGAGVVALRRAPYARFGLLLSAVGLSALIGALHDANAPLPYTAGVLASNLVFALLVHALLAFPKGRLFSRADRVIVAVAYANVLALQVLAVVFDPLTRWASDHPRNLALIDSHASLATVLEEVEAAIAVAIALAVVARISRRASSATQVARRQLLPVLFVGKVSLLIFAAGLALAPLSSGAAVLGIGLGLLVSVALPVAFLGVILHGRLARAAVGELLVELREGGEAPDLEDALRRALGDPSLELARRDEKGRFVAGGGRPLALPAGGGARVATPILHQGQPVGMLVHDRSLRLRPELLDAVGAAAGFALANERALEAAQRADAELRRLADEQAALRRVATLVAADAPPDDVFQAVTEEVSLLLGIPSGALMRFDDDETATLVGIFGDQATAGFVLGDRLAVEPGMASWTVLHEGKVGRVDGYDGIPGEVARRMRETGFQRVVAVPVTVAGTTWGALVAALRRGERLSSETERRLEQFAALVAMALASAQARDELAASRRRIVEAGDAERRRLERNLHDGAQQRLVGLSVGLGLARRKLGDSPAEAAELLEATSDELSEAITDLRELAQGIHPAVLTDRGLGEALEVLAARTPIPVVLDLRLPRRLPDAVEVAAYYVASEALANVVKHSGASAARVRADGTNGCAEIEVADDGTGAADPNGSGLRGLRDRVETLDGRLRVESVPGRGTLVRAELPLRGEAR